MRETYRKGKEWRGKREETGNRMGQERETQQATRNIWWKWQRKDVRERDRQRERREREAKNKEKEQVRRKWNKQNRNKKKELERKRVFSGGESGVCFHGGALKQSGWIMNVGALGAMQVECESDRNYCNFLRLLSPRRINSFQLLPALIINPQSSSELRWNKHRTALEMG